LQFKYYPTAFCGKIRRLFLKKSLVFEVEWSLRAGVAQSVEQLICNQQVAGSSPIASSID
jgi:hypothetical protein